MESILPIGYVGLLIVLLSLAALFILQQTLKTRKIESTLSKLQNKLKNEKGTFQEYYELGSIYLDKKLFVQAISLFQKAIKAAEDTEENIAPIYNALGFAYFGQEQYDLALRNYKEAVRLAPTYVIALNNLGHAYEHKKLNSQALETYEEVLKLEPNNAIAKRRVEVL
ncbi:MAG TPA: tetratricopeptide repeat protein, partial [Allocoleopsis sp.]